MTDGLTSALKISGSSGGVPFEDARVRGSAILIDTTAGGGDDILTIYGADNAHTNTSLLITTGAEAGDVVNVNGTATFSGPVTIHAPTVKLNAPITNTIAGTATTVNVTSLGQIQDGIDVAAPGGTVKVAAGTYAEHLVLAKQLTLEGAQAGVDARGRVADESTITAASGTLLTLQNGSAGSVIDGFTFRGGWRGIESASGPLNALQILNNRLVGFTGNGVFLNDNGVDITVHQNVIDGSSKTGSGALFHLDQDNFDGFQFTNNHVVNGRVAGSGTGFFVDGNHNVGQSVARSPLFSGNLFDNNTTGANLGRFAFEYGTVSQNVFSNNSFDGLQGGIQHSDISRNTFSGNGRSGLALTGFGGAGDITRGAQYNAVTENVFTGNASEDVLFASSQFPGTISTNHVVGNSFGSTRAATYNGTEIIDVSRNWWGTSQNPETGGKIGGTGAGNLDYTPWLDSGADLAPGLPGFQGDFSVLHVDDDSPQFGPVGRITEAIGLLPASGGTIYVHAGTYTETVDATAPAKDVNLSPGASPGQVVINGNLTLNAGDTLSMELAGLNPATEYDNFVVQGDVVLNGATLAASRVTSFVPPNGASFTLIDNDDNDAVAGTFAGLAEGATVVLSGIPFTISYQGGSGNDVVLTIVTPTDVYIDDSWSGTPIGTTPATSDPVELIFQYNAFAEIQGGIDRVAASGTVTVYGGAYSNAVDFNKVLQPVRIATNSMTPASTLVEIEGAITLDVDTTFQQYDATSLAFNSTIDANADSDSESLVLNGVNPMTFAGSVGGLVPLGSIITDAGGATKIDTATVNAATLDFNDDVILAVDTTLTGKTGVTFNGTVDGDGSGVWDLTLDAGVGDVVFGDAVGASGGVGKLTIVSARDVTILSSVRTASLVQELGSGTTAFYGVVTATGADGIDLTTDSVTFNDAVSTVDANGPLAVHTAQGIAIHALVETGAGPVELIAGADVIVSPTGRISTNGAQVEIMADGRLVMSDGAVVETGAGTIRVSADEGLGVGRLVSATLVSLTSASGAIQDAGNTGGADIESPLLALRAADGIGVGDPLETRVETIAADNRGSGGIQIVNEGPLVIGTVEGLAGMTNRGNGALAVANEGDLLVSNPVLNVGGGDTSLMANGGTLEVRATITNDLAGNAGGGSITLQADEDVEIQRDVITNGGQRDGANADQGVILVDAGEQIQLDAGVTIATGTGQMTAAPAPEDMPPPVDVRLVPVDQGGSNVNSMGRAIVEVTVGDVGENYQITIDWSNGVATYPPGTSVDGQTRFEGGPPSPTYRFDRYYTSNPDPTNASAPIPVAVTIAYDGRSQANLPLNGIVFKEGGQVLSTTVSDVLTVPGTGLFAFIKVVESEIVPVALRQETGTVPLASQAVSGSQQASSYEAPAAELEFAAHTGLQLFFRRVDAAGQEGEDVALPPELLERGLFEVFQRFPNGRYRIYLKEPNSDRERLIQELHIYQGRIVPPDFRDDASQRQVGDESEKPVEQSPASEAEAEGGGEGDQNPPVAEPAAKPVAPQAEDGPADGESVQPAVSASAVGGAAIALGMTGNGISRQWAERVDRAFQAGTRSLSKAARLTRRLQLRNTKA
ncbi:MAG: right-handed parallel beta-helix repeat-containing protein [Pirellulaceae bacterium]|nr:right-handed parallel beta-helix repeat-containing protein [Pirellulaceae bacterium]